MDIQPTLNSADIALIRVAVKCDIDSGFEEFALMVGAGFEEVRNEFKSVHQRFDELEARMDYRFNIVDKKLDHITETKVSYTDHTFLSKRVDKLEEQAA